MSTIYLFQIDGAQNNDPFFNSLRPSASLFYKGTTFRAGDWVPDGVRIDLGESRCLLTLIELEDTRPNALISSRKYLPENSDLIIRALGEYIDRIVSECQSTGDSREVGFVRLKEILIAGTPFEVTTACALRSAADFIEELPLIDHRRPTESPEPFTDRTDGTDEAKDGPSLLQGTLRFGQERLYALARCVKVLDAVIRHEDHGEGMFHSWTSKAPLRRLLRNRTDSPLLKGLIAEINRKGMTLDIEALLSEIVSIWPGTSLEEARRLISRYLPIASRIRGHDRMRSILEQARGHLDKSTHERTTPTS